MAIVHLTLEKIIPVKIIATKYEILWINSNYIKYQKYIQHSPSFSFPKTEAEFPCHIASNFYRKFHYLSLNAVKFCSFVDL